MERGALVTRVAELEVAVRAVVANAIPVAVIAGDVYELPRKVVDELYAVLARRPEAVEVTLHDVR
jgi:hypothetical protein